MEQEGRRSQPRLGPTSVSEIPYMTLMGSVRHGQLIEGVGSPCGPLT